MRKLFTKGMHIINMNLAIKVHKINVDLLALKTAFARKRSHRWHPRHYTDSIELVYDLIGKFAKEHKGEVSLFSGGEKTVITIRIKNHAITSVVKHKEVVDKLPLMLLQCIEDERQLAKDDRR